MADDPNKKHVDGWFVSNQPHEYEYFKSTIKEAFPHKTDEEISEAILSCRKAIAPSEGRKKLTECVHKKLGGGPGGARDDRARQPDRRHG
jgi:hypothetical protein